MSKEELIELEDLNDVNNHNLTNNTNKKHKKEISEQNQSKISEKINNCLKRCRIMKVVIILIPIVWVLYNYGLDFFSNDIFSYYFEDDNDGHENKSYIINETGRYKICVYGARAISGGTRGRTCGTHIFQ